MPFPIYDYRRDIKNLFVTPQLRSRFLRMEPGEVGGRHSHDLGHEIFLILEGQCEMEIDGESAVLGPGQLCVAFADQMHRAKNVGDVPMIMYLSVTPHVEPTHTVYDQATGQRRPPRYNPATLFDQPDTVADVPTAELAERHLAAVRALAEVTRAAAEAQAAGAAALAAAAGRNDPAAVATVMDTFWEQVYATHRSVNAMTEAWNKLAPRGSGREVTT